MPKLKTDNFPRSSSTPNEEQKLRQKLKKLFKIENNSISKNTAPPHKIMKEKEENFQNMKHEKVKKHIHQNTTTNENIKKKNALPSKFKENSVPVKKFQEVPKSQTKSGKKRMAQPQGNNKKTDGVPRKKSKQESRELVVHSTVEESSSSEDEDFFPYLEEDEEEDFGEEEEEEEEDFGEEEEEEEESEWSLGLEEDSEYSFDSKESQYNDDYYSYTNDEFSFENNQTHEYDDLIIHQGTAIKRALEPDDGEVDFDSDNADLQIVELVSKEETIEDVSSPCPQLVPIEDVIENNLEKDDSTSGSNSDDEYSEVTDSDWSYVSEHISEKYQNLDNFDDNHSHNDQINKMKADIIYAKGNIEFTIMNDDTKETNLINTQMELTPACQMSQHLHVSEHSYAKIIPGTLIEKEAEIPQEENVDTGTRMFPSKNERYVLVLLKSSIYFYGTIRFKLVAGKVDCYGYQPPLNKEFELFSTRGCCSVSLMPISSNCGNTVTIENILQNLANDYDEKILNYLHDNYIPENDALVLLRRNNERAYMISHFNRNMNENVFPNVPSGGKKNPLQSFEQQLDCFINESSTQALQMPKEWQNIPLTNQSGQAEKRLMLVGGKAVGKSTLLRYVLNRLLNVPENAEKGVLIIDLDVGQGEIGLPQTISCTLLHKPLLGPGFFYKYKPDCSYLVGQVNISLCAQRYLHAVKLLLEHCRANAEYAKVPWLINTMGYNQGIGMELIAAICELLHPTDVVQIRSNKSVNNFPCWLEFANLRKIPRALYDFSVHTLNLDAELPKYEIPPYRLHTLKTAVKQKSRYQREWHMSAKDLRYASLLAQISDILSDDVSYLTDRIPYCAALTDIKVISLSDPYSTQEELHQALTANLVYLCQLIPEKDTNTPMKCFGIGIVRSLDAEHIYIIPAAMIDNMNRVNCVVMSEQPLPTANLKLQGARLKNTFLPFLYTTEDHASSTVKHIYRRPAHFLTGKHKALSN